MCGIELSSSKKEEPRPVLHTERGEGNHTMISVLAEAPGVNQAAPELYLQTLRETAALYIARGIAVVPLVRDTKEAKRSNWTSRTFTPDDFTEQDAIGIKTGFASDYNQPGHSLVCVDLDSPEARELADSHLPPTGMMVGREGKRRIHRYYLVPNESVPTEHVLNSGSAAQQYAEQLGIHPGPRKYQFRYAENNKTAIDLQASGQQLAAPPTIHPKDGLPYEWDNGERGEPLVIPYPELLSAVCRLALAAGARLPKQLDPNQPQKPTRERRQKPQQPTAEPCPESTAVSPPHTTHTTPVGSCDPLIVADYANYLRKAGLPRTGQGGNDKTFRLLACGLNDFGLPRETVLSVFDAEVNALLRGLRDEWSADELTRMLDSIESRTPDAEHVRGGKRRGSEHKPDVPEMWDSPQKLAREFAAEHTYRFVKDSAFRYADGSYRESSTGMLRSEVIRFCERKAQEEYRRREQRWKASGGEAELESWREQLKQAHDSTADDKQAAITRIEKCIELAEKRKPKAAKPFTRTDINNVVDSFAAIRQLPDNTAFNTWIGTNPHPGKSFLCVENGLLDVRSGTLVPHSPDYFTLTQLPTQLVAGSVSEKWGEFLTEVLEGDAKRIDVLQEFFGACLVPSVPLKQFLVLAGGGNNGKSVVLHVLKLLLGERSTAAVSLDELTGNRFAKFGLLGKLANIVGDQGFVTLRDEGIIKTLTGGDLVAFEQKGRDTLFAVNTAKIIVAANEIPKFNDTSEAIWNRLLIVPFRWTVPTDRMNPELLTAGYWNGEIPGILNWAVEGANRLHESRYQFTRSDVCDEAKDVHRKESNPLRDFLLTNYTEGSETDFIRTDDVYNKFRRYAETNGIKHIPNARQVGKLVSTLYPQSTGERMRVDGEVKRVWYRVRESNDG